MMQLDGLTMRSLFTKRHYLVWSVVVVLFALLILGVFGLPRISRIFSLVRNRETVNSQIAQLTRKAAELEQIRVSPEINQQATVDAVLPSRKAFLELLASLQSVSKDSNVSLKDVAISPGSIATQSASLAQTDQDSGTGAFSTIEIHLVASGTLEDVETFLRLSERVAPFTSISSVSIQKNEGLVQAELNIKSYYFTQDITTTLAQSLPAVTQNDKLVLDEIGAYFFPSIADREEILGGGSEDFFQVEGVELLEKQ